MKILDIKNRIEWVNKRAPLTDHQIELLTLAFHESSVVIKSISTTKEICGDIYSPSETPEVPVFINQIEKKG